MQSSYFKKLQIVFYCLNPVSSIWQSLKHVMETTLNHMCGSYLAAQYLK